MDLKEIVSVRGIWLIQIKVRDYWRAFGGIHKLRHTLRGAEGARRSVTLSDKGGEGS